MENPQRHSRLIFNFMENMDMDNFVVVGIDRKGEPLTVWRTTSAAGERALEGFAEDFLNREDCFGPRGGKNSKP